MALRDVNRKLAKLDPRIELVNNRDGYLYFSFDDVENNWNDTKSILVPRFNSYTDDEWVAMGEEKLAEFVELMGEALEWRAGKTVKF